MASENPDVEAFLVQINPRVTAEFTGHGSRVLHALEAETGKSFLFEGSEGLTLEHFAITFQGTREEVEERALPFRQGDEVLVEIVEPHMYDVDDAVAKIDGYIISIAGAAPHVGEKRMVRIDQVGRTAASALLLDESGEVVRPVHGPPPRRPGRGPDGGCPNPSRPRRRRRPPAADDAEPGGNVPEPGAHASTDGSESAANVRRRMLPRPRGVRQGRTPARTLRRTRAERMTYNPSLGVVAAGAGDAVRLPRPRRARSNRRHSGKRER